MCNPANRAADRPIIDAMDREPDDRGSAFFSDPEQRTDAARERARAAERGQTPPPAGGRDDGQVVR